MKPPAFLLILLAMLFSSGSAFAWSSTASRTQSRIQQLSCTIQAYQMDNGHLPSPSTYREDLQKGGYEDAGNLQDAWKQLFVYRVPGTHGEFDLYSVGPDGIDNQGAGDDVTKDGVNDGYHWKKTWPEGRRLANWSLLLGAACLLLGRFFPWRIVLPIVGLVAGLGLRRSCILLLHPGIVSSNASLEGTVLFMDLILLVCLFFLFRAFRRPTAATDSLPTFLSETQIHELLAPFEPSQKLPVVRSRSAAQPKRRTEMTAAELKDLILRSVLAKHLPGGNLAVSLPDRTLVGNPDGLYWLETKT